MARTTQVSSVSDQRWWLRLPFPIAADIAVVFFKVTDNMGSAVVAGATALGVLLGVWLGYPVLRRNSAAPR